MTTDRPLRLIFAGTPAFAAIHLEALLRWSECQVVGVYTQPDSAKVRGKTPPSPVKSLAAQYGIPVFQPETLKTAEEQAKLAALNPDVMVVVAYGMLLPKSILTTPRFGCINVHASILPQWRGAAPIERAIEAGDAETGITIMQMDEGLDTGDMLEVRRCSISPDDSVETLEEKLSKIGAGALIDALSKLREGNVERTRQDDEKHTYAPKIRPEELILDWRQPAENLARKIQALAHRGTYSVIQGMRIKILSVEPVSATDRSAPPGTIIKASPQGIFVQCGPGVLSIKTLQIPGKKPLRVSEVLNGRAELFKPGHRFDHAG